jgi:hypothetical protein
MLSAARCGRSGTGNDENPFTLAEGLLEGYLGIGEDQNLVGDT